MEEKQEGPEGKQTPRVTGATSSGSPLSTSVCPATRALTSEKQGDRSIFYTVTCDPPKSIPNKMDCQYCSVLWKYYYNMSKRITVEFALLRYKSLRYKSVKRKVN